MDSLALFRLSSTISPLAGRSPGNEGAESLRTGRALVLFFYIKQNNASHFIGILRVWTGEGQTRKLEFEEG